MMNARDYWLWSHFMCDYYDEEGADCSSECPFYDTRTEFCCLTCYDKAMNIDVAIEKVEGFRKSYLDSIGTKTFLQKVEEVFSIKVRNGLAFKGFVTKTCPKDYFDKEETEGMPCSCCDFTENNMKCWNSYPAASSMPEEVKNIMEKY